MTQSFVETPEHVQSVPMHGTRATGLKIGSFRTARTIVIRAWGVDAEFGLRCPSSQKKNPAEGRRGFLTATVGYRGWRA